MFLSMVCVCIHLTVYLCVFVLSGEAAYNEKICKGIIIIRHCCMIHNYAYKSVCVHSACYVRV